jgi:hypothetical protein
MKPVDRLTIALALWARDIFLQAESSRNREQNAPFFR